ncbi:Usp6 N-Terminal-Like Protein [Manis pentadactyla]|nr:Usp6 N-Terminal-Like Protein [Manis pentadactyla]
MNRSVEPTFGLDHCPVVSRRGLIRLKKDGEDKERKAPSDSEEANQQRLPPTPNQKTKAGGSQQRDVSSAGCPESSGKKSKQAQSRAIHPLMKASFQT